MFNHLKESCEYNSKTHKYEFIFSQDEVEFIAEYINSLISLKDILLTAMQIGALTHPKPPENYTYVCKQYIKSSVDVIQAIESYFGEKRND